MVRRRGLIGALGACSLAGLGPALPRALLAAVPTEARFVLLILRGALDGLAAVPAYADPAFAAMRGELAAGTADGMTDLDGRFGLHASLPTLAGLWRERELLVVHAVASPYRERSHFEGQDLLENGAASAGEHRDGWLARALGLMGAHTTTMAMAAGSSVPLVLRGQTAVATLGPELLPALGPDLLRQLRALYGRDDLLGPVLETALAGRTLTEGLVDRKSLAPAGREPGAEKLRALAIEVGRLLAGPAGLRVAAMELGGFDTHVGQIGRLHGGLASIDAVIAGLVTGSGEAWRRTVVAIVTEFGRTVRPNGSGGTDHGTGTIAMLAGGAVEGGRVLTRWPGLDPTRLLDGRDLAPTTDLRAVLKAVLEQHLGLPADGVARMVFPHSDEAAALREIVRA